ncbi:MAG: DUF4179 domain-containing protein [Chloroflexi bacterium]|nr:DUF4179 domain-containing protein [Chloroflexota bacterium]
MNDRDLARLLDAIASEEIPDDMNLWNDIKAQLNELPAVPARRTASALSRIAAVFAVLLIAGSVYAVYQVITTRGGDPGIMAVDDLVTPLNLVQSSPSDDVNITVDWAYADGHRIAVGWTVDYASELDVPQPTFVLTDGEGTAFGPADFLRGGGGGGGGDGERNTFGSVTSFDATGIKGAPESLMLSLTATFDPANGPGEITGGGGGGGSGGGGSAGQTPPEPVEIAPFTVTFEFEVPFFRARETSVPGSVDDAGITVTLESLTYAPSVSIGRLCYTLPDDAPGLRPHFAVNAQGFETAAFSPDDGDIASMSGAPICGDLLVYQPAETATGRLEIVIDRFQTEAEITRESFDALVAAVEAEGLPVDFDLIETGDLKQRYAMSYGTTGEGLTGAEQAAIWTRVNDLIAQYMQQAVTGEWVLPVTVGG